MQTLVVAAPLMLLGAIGLRTGVRATPDALHIANGIRSRSFNWADVRSFVIQNEHGSRRLLAVVEPGSAVSLPVANGGSMLTRKSELVAGVR